MLSVSTCTATMAANYYEQDNYYTRDQSMTDTWQGKLCQDVGLKDGQAVNAKQFQFMLDHSGSKCAAYDLTFSAPKSVSIAAEMNTELKAEMLKAHHDAITETLQEIEENEIGARVTKNGQTEWVKTGKMAAAKFDHTVSREGDMQLHTHAVVINKTELNGKSYAIDGHKFFDNQKIYGQMYRTKLAANVQKLGYEVIQTDANQGFWEMKEIRPDVIEHFSKRRTQIKAVLEKNGETGAEAAQRANLKTRKAKEHIDMDTKRAEWQQELSEMGQQVPAKNLELAVQKMTKVEQCAAFNRAVECLEKQKFAWTAKELEQSAMAEGCTTGMMRKNVTDLIKRSHLVRLTAKKEAGLETKPYYTTRKNIAVERQIKDNVVFGKGKMQAVSAATSAKTLADVSKANGWKLGTEQMNVVSHIATSRDQFIAIRGLAGTGKTFALSAAREVLEKNGYEVRGMSATGQATDELATDAHIVKCSTIHHALNEAERLAGNAIPGQDYANKTTWKFDGLQPSTKPTVWFMDEASLTDNNLFHNVQEMAKLRGDKVVFIGDDKQMPPVGVGNAYANLVQKKQISTAELTNIRRQNDPELLKAVQEAVQGQTKISLEIITKDITEIPTRIKRLNAVTKAYTSLSQTEQAETLVLTARNKDRMEINNRIRKQLIKQGELNQGMKFEVQYGKEKALQERFFSKGDKVVFLKNDNKLGVKNGTKGSITKLDGNDMTIATGKDKSVTINVKNYNHIDHGYCVTPYKGQGATVKRALVNMDSKDIRLNNRNSYYVDISRAKQHVRLFCDSRAKLNPQISKFAHKITSRDFKSGFKASMGKKGKKVGVIKKGSGKLVNPVKIPKVKVPKAVANLSKAVSICGKFGGLSSLVSLPINLIRTAVDLIKLPFDITKGHEKIQFPNSAGKILGDIRTPEKGPEMNLAPNKNIVRSPHK